VGQQNQTDRARNDRGKTERSGTGKNPEACRMMQVNSLSTVFSHLWK
jgi:hypothetical protein